MDVHIVRSYEHIGGAVVPVAMESTAHVRLLGLLFGKVLPSFVVQSGLCHRQPV